MTHVHREVSRHVEHASDPQPPTKEDAPRRWHGPKWARRERDWLEEFWNASEQFLTRAKCPPGLSPSQRETIRRRWLKEASTTTRYGDGSDGKTTPCASRSSLVQPLSRSLLVSTSGTGMLRSSASVLQFDVQTFAGST